MNMIAERQLRPQMLDLLRARTLVYRRAKRGQAIVLALNVTLPVASAIAAVLMPSLRPAIALCAVVLGMFDVTAIGNWMKGRLKVGAKLQEEFDFEVLEIDWNEFVAGSKIDAEDIFEDGRCRTLGDADEQRLRDWYPPVVAEAPIEVARVICQRENLLYDSGLRQAYRRIIFWSVFVVVVGATAVSLITNPDFTSFVLALVQAAPALTWALRESKRQSDTLETLTRLKNESEKLLKATIDGLDASEARRRSRELQDAIFTHRSTSSLVFDWLYYRLRPRLEAKLIHGAEHWIKEYRRASA